MSLPCFDCLLIKKKEEVIFPFIFLIFHFQAERACAVGKDETAHKQNLD